MPEEQKEKNGAERYFLCHLLFTFSEYAKNAKHIHAIHADQAPKSFFWIV
jgi:hypothetical protein